MATYTISTNNSIWARSLVALNANAEAYKNDEHDSFFDQDFVEAINYSLAMWLENENDLSNEELMKFACILRVRADRIERMAYEDGAKCDDGVQEAMAGETNESAQNGTNFRQDEEVGLQLRRLAVLAGLRPSTVLRLLVQNAPPIVKLRALAAAEDTAK